jgi:hypothetical protein
LAEQQQNEPSVEELIEQIRGIDVGQFLLSTVSTLASLTYGKLDNGDLTGARVGIEALTALIPVLEGQVEAETIRDLQSAVANLQVAYADAAGSPGAST